MTFVEFARSHGILLETPPPIGVWKRYRTLDKPANRNGAVKFMGTYGFVQNHAMEQEVSIWRSNGVSMRSHREVQRVARDASREIARNIVKAAERATWILDQCQARKHPYLAAKGFPDELVNVWRTDQGSIAVIPMRKGETIVGCQLIDEAGDKKFLYGQRTSGAQFVFANRGQHMLCEGFATGLSARQALNSLQCQYSLHVCFSAGNMKKIAAELPGGIVIADNDASGTGERIAREIGWRYWMSDVVGEDANDYHRRMGLFALSQGITKTLRAPRSPP